MTDDYEEPPYEGVMTYCCRLFFKSHLWGREQSRILILFRVLAVLLGAICLLIDLDVLRHSSEVREMDGRIFAFELTNVGYEIAAMIYASGAAVLGTTADAVLLLGFATANCILVYKNCPNISQQRVIPVIWVLRSVFLAVGVELTHRNFTKWANYWRACRKSARTMLLQSILFSFTILYLEASGLKIVYDNVITKAPQCSYHINQCGIPEIYYPNFASNDSCVEDFVEYIRTREEVRIVRIFVYLHIAYYSMFNKPFLTITLTTNRLLNVFCVIIWCGFACLVISVVWSNVAPFHFVGWPKKYLFDTIEAMIFTLLFIMLLYAHNRFWNCFGFRRTIPIFDDEHRTPMEGYPSILFNLI